MKNNLNNLKKKFFLNAPNFSLSWCLILLVVCWGAFLFWSGLPIKGPFIFADEGVYFDFARAIFHGKPIAYTQYGPLYPALMAPAFYFKKVYHSYYLMRCLNIILLLSATLPAYLISKELFKNKWLKILLPVCVLITPFSGFVYMIWAEPLYIALFYWTCFLLLQHIKNPTLVKSILLGILLATLYYTKPGAGLAAQAAMFFSLAIFMLASWNLQPRKAKLLTGVVVLTCLLLNVFWMWYYTRLGVSVIGYPGETAIFMQAIKKGEYLRIALNTAKGFFYQFSYFFIGTWGLMGIGMAILATQWGKLQPVERNVTLFAITYGFGLIVLTAVGLSAFGTGGSYLDIRMTIGRYFSVVLPLLITLILHLSFRVKKEKKANEIFWFSVVFLTVIIAIFASPFYVRWNGVSQTPDFIIFAYFVPAKPLIEKPDFLLRVGVPILMGGFALAVLILREKKYTPMVVSSIILIGNFCNTLFLVSKISEMGAGHSSITNIYKDLQKHNINPSQLILDEKLKKHWFWQFHTPFWLDREPVYQNVNEIKRKANKTGFTYFISENGKLSLDKFYSTGSFIIYRIDNKNDTKNPP